MGGITLVDTPAEPAECYPAGNGLKNLAHVEVLNQLALEASALVGQNQAQAQTHISPSSTSFSISDFLVPGLQTKTWEDWQVADELNPFASGMDTQDFSTDLTMMPFQFSLDGMLGNAMWDASTTSGLPADQAYDEFVFDLAPSNFATPTTVNIADLIVGPDSMAPSVSPLDLATTMPLNHNNAEDIALATLYGFTESETIAFDSDSGSDLSDAESSCDEDEDEDEDERDSDNEATVPLIQASSRSTKEALPTENSMAERIDATNVMFLKSVIHVPESLTEPQQQPVTEDPHKRRMEEALVARINNDLGPEHMAGLFEILKGSNGQATEDEDEEMEVDLSSLDETTLVEVYQYVETCCMQTLGSILAAEERKRVAAENEAKKQLRMASRRDRTPELSPSHSSSSSSPSPPHPSSCGSNSNKRRSATTSTSCTGYYDRHGSEDQAEALWMASQHKSKRKRVNKNGPVCMGGGGTGKGQRIQTMAEDEQEDNSDVGEDEEIDIMGI
ncbi:hypothetical protein BGX28_008217 [Mortierella sp. GBA30]|nr:hypothetical protein BGX28_008217 [Mortierella sp. GBA30]